MGKILNVIKWGVTLGKEPQNFLGAKWIGRFLKSVPESKKRIWALRILEMSPHYFLFPDAPEYRGLSKDEYLEAAFETLSKSRREIVRLVFKPHLDENLKVLDYGCGPGFMSKAASPFVKKIYAVDISKGAIDCAKILNRAENIEYLVAGENGLETIPDASLDVCFSYAVAQHLTDEVFEIVLENCRRKLKTNGKLLIHIQLVDKILKTENDWRQDTSIKGKLKFNYGLHCFGRTEERYRALISKHGFENIETEQLKGFDPKYDEELKSQRLLIAYKNA